MGFSSWVCNHCNKSILAKYVTMNGNVNRAWSEAVAVLEDRILIGIYDGYGRVVGPESQDVVIADRDFPRFYHKTCYEAAGCPKFGATGPSRPAYDQGYFINPDHYAGSPPGC